MKSEWQRYSAVLGDDAPTFAEYVALKEAGDERLLFLELAYSRRRALLDNPALALPNAARATADSRKFTHYLFNPNSRSGYPKGMAFDSRLGYNKSNWEDLYDEVLTKAVLYPVRYKGRDSFGEKYEQLIILYGPSGNPANVLVAWMSSGMKTWLTSLYLREVE